MGAIKLNVCNSLSAGDHQPFITAAQITQITLMSRAPRLGTSASPLKNATENGGRGFGNVSIEGDILFLSLVNHLNALPLAPLTGAAKGKTFYNFPGSELSSGWDGSECAGSGIPPGAGKVKRPMCSPVLPLKRKSRSHF